MPHPRTVAQTVFCLPLQSRQEMNDFHSSKKKDDEDKDDEWKSELFGGGSVSRVSFSQLLLCMYVCARACEYEFRNNSGCNRRPLTLPPTREGVCMCLIWA